MLGTELSPKEARYRARLPESTLVLEKKAIKDTAEINAHLSGGDRPTRVTAGFFDGREYYIVSSPKKKSGGRVSKTRGEARVYKEHDSAHPSKKLIPVGSCKIEDPTREGKSMLGLSGAEATACLALLELPTSETRKNVKAVIGSPSARDRGKLTGKGWRAHQSPGKRSTPPSNFFSRPEVQSAAEKLGVATPIRKRDEDKEKKPYKGRALKF